MVVNDDYSEKVQYDDPDYPVMISRDFLSSYPNYAAPSHWHDDIELIAVLSGQMQYSVNGEIFGLCAGEGVFINSRQMHFGFSLSVFYCIRCCLAQRLHMSTILCCL